MADLTRRDENYYYVPSYAAVRFVGHVVRIACPSVRLSVAH